MISVEFECDYRSCNEGVGINPNGPDPSRASVDLNVRRWNSDVPIRWFLPEGWTVFGTETLFTYCPKHSTDERKP